MKKQALGILLSGSAAGMVNGLFGAGGGMVLIPLLSQLAQLSQTQLFPVSVAMILPMTIVSATVSAFTIGLPFTAALPYLLGGTAGGVAAGLLGRKVSPKWLHRILGFMILTGGIRYLC